MTATPLPVSEPTPAPIATPVVAPLETETPIPSPVAVTTSTAVPLTDTLQAVPPTATPAATLVPPTATPARSSRTVTPAPTPLPAPPHKALQYRGGPVLRTFEIHPLYYGNWSNAERTAQQNYLVALASYLSGGNEPAGQQPMLWQYGVNQATVARGVSAGPSATPATLSHNDVANIIQANQSNGNLPAFGPTTLIMVFLAHHFGLVECSGCGYHHSESASAFWAVVPQDAGVGKPVAGPVPDSPVPFQLVTGHEVFEAAADPAIDHAPGWDESVDDCPDGLTSYGGSWIDVTFGFIPGVADNAQNGTCSTTGYNSTDEVQVYGSSYADYRKKYDELWPQGWRLYILQSYVLPNSQVLYNAVWRPGTMPETQLYGSTYADYRKKYDALYPQGWRLYILDTFVMPNGQVLYNAVWRLGTSNRPL